MVETFLHFRSLKMKLQSSKILGIYLHGKKNKQTGNRENF